MSCKATCWQAKWKASWRDHESGRWPAHYFVATARIAGEVFGVPVDPDFQPPRIGDVRESLADISQARKLLGYEPATTLEQGLAQTIDYYRSIAKV